MCQAGLLGRQAERLMGVLVRDDRLVEQSEAAGKHQEQGAVARCDRHYEFGPRAHKAIAKRDQERCVERGDEAQNGDLSLAESVPELSLKPVHLSARQLPYVA
jgi:hypothetical protein